MTFVGKILVILIMAMSLIFLGVSTVVFTTATNWKEETAKQKKVAADLGAQLTTAKAIQADAEGKLTQAQQEHVAATQNLEKQIAALRDDNIKAQSGITAAQGALTDAEANAKLALEETQARVADVKTLRDQLSAVTDQANKFKIHQTELNNEILTLKRQLDAAERNAKQLRETSWKFVSLLKKNGLSTDISRVEAVEPAPDVEGKVLKVDEKNRRLELSIGSDDGLAEGQELYLYRTDPPEFLGKVKISVVDPDQAVATVIGTTVNGKKIKEGDNVASTIRKK
jgi:hypothetical protein